MSTDAGTPTPEWDPELDREWWRSRGVEECMDRMALLAMEVNRLSREREADEQELGATMKVLGQALNPTAELTVGGVLEMAQALVERYEAVQAENVRLRDEFFSRLQTARRLRGGQMSADRKAANLTAHSQQWRDTAELEQERKANDLIAQERDAFEKALTEAHLAMNDNFVLYNRYKQRAADLQARLEEVEAALHRISLGAQNSMTSKEELGKEARRALSAQPTAAQPTDWEPWERICDYIRGINTGFIIVSAQSAWPNSEANLDAIVATHNAQPTAAGQEAKRQSLGEDDSPSEQPASAAATRQSVEAAIADSKTLNAQWSANGCQIEGGFKHVTPEQAHPEPTAYSRDELRGIITGLELAEKIAQELGQERSEQARVGESQSVKDHLSGKSAMAFALARRFRAEIVRRTK